MKRILLIPLLLLLIGSVSALSSVGTYKQDECINLIQTCDNCTYINLSAVQTASSEIFILNAAMTKSGNFYNHSFCNTSALGTYIINGFGDLDGQDSVWSYSITITKNGFEPAGDIFKSLIYIGFIVASAGLFVTLLIGIAKFVSADTTVFDVIVSWGFYVLLMIVFFLAKNFLLTTFVEDLAGTFLTITVWSNGVLPLISLVFAMFVRWSKKKKPESPSQFSGRYLS